MIRTDKTNIINDRIDARIIERLLEHYSFTAEEFIEDDGSVTLWSVELDLGVNEKSKEEAIRKLAADILEFSGFYYEDFDFWYSGANTKQHLPYILKALVLNDVEKIGELIVCRPGEI